MLVFPVGASVERELHLVMDAIVSYPIHPFILCLISFIFKGKAGGRCPSMVTNGDTHKHFTEMRRLAHDETPFLLDIPPRATTLVW
jgi:hypothetical protein